MVFAHYKYTTRCRSLGLAVISVPKSERFCYNLFRNRNADLLIVYTLLDQEILTLEPYNLFC